MGYEFHASQELCGGGVGAGEDAVVAVEYGTGVFHAAELKAGDGYHVVFWEWHVYAGVVF